MRISATRAVERSLSHSKGILFDTFDLRKWLGLSVCLYLNFLWISWPDYGQRADGTFPDFPTWVAENPGKTGAIVAASILLAGFSAWVQSRAKFMFLDNVVSNQGAIRPTWREMKPLGNHLFPLQFLILGVAGIGFAGSYFQVITIDLDPQRLATLQPAEILRSVGVMYLLMGVIWVALWLVYIVIGDFVVPIMYRRNAGVREAFGLFLSTFARKPGALTRFVALKFLLWCAAAVLMLIGGCISICITGLPMAFASIALIEAPWLIVLISMPINFIYAAMFLPIFVLLRLYPIYFIEQFGPDWRFFERQGPEAAVVRPAPVPGSPDEPSSAI